MFECYNLKSSAFDYLDLKVTDLVSLPEDKVEDDESLELFEN